LDYSKDASANIFSLFGVGAICGNILMGLSTDLLTIRSPVFILGIIVSTLSTLALTLWGDAKSGGNSLALISVVMFFLGASLNGSSIIIAAIECDLGK
jgi:sugar phosphate permease